MRTVFDAPFVFGISSCYRHSFLLLLLFHRSLYDFKGKSETQDAARERPMPKALSLNRSRPRVSKGVCVLLCTQQPRIVCIRPALEYRKTGNNWVSKTCAFLHANLRPLIHYYLALWSYTTSRDSSPDLLRPASVDRSAFYSALSKESILKPSKLYSQNLRAGLIRIQLKSDRR